MQNNAKIGGILSIISGALGALTMLCFIGLAVFMMLMPNIISDMDKSYDNSTNAEIVFIIMGVIYLIIGIGGALVGALAIAGGVFALKQKRWAWALAGAIAGNLLFPFCGIPAVIFVSLGRREFGKSGLVPSAPMEKIVG
jgi:hypothetical protein